MNSTTETESSARRRRRASMACLNCRKSRIRCKIDQGQNTCSQCRQAGIECAFDSRDGRKNRANSKAVANELSKRIQHLESLLKESGQGHPILDPVLGPDTQQDSPTDDAATADLLHPMGTDSETQSTPFFDEDPPPYPESFQQHTLTQPAGATGQTRAILGRLMPRPVKFDMASGRVRFFGPTTNMHILSRSTVDSSKTPETFWPISTLVRDLTPETHDYLIDLFFDCHNSAVHIVHKWAFFDDLKVGGTQFYSNFLHMCILAEGYRYADKNRLDIKKLGCSGADSSTFHTKAKKMAELELVKPGGVPSLQAFFLLGDLEVGIGRDDTGWMFAGMAFRLLFDVGLHVDPCELRLTDREVQIRHMVLWACIMNDVYWAVYLGRPTMLKPNDIAPACLNKDFDRLIQSQMRTYAYEKTIETRVYEALLQLMDLLEPLCETRDLRKNLKPADAYFKIATLDRRLNNWYSDLPERLRWTDDNIKIAPATFYLLHTQYHTALILLHRTFPSQPPQPSNTRYSGTTHFSTLSRSVCVSNAVQVAEIVGLYRRRFKIQQIFVTGLQHVGTAATALMAEISILQTAADHEINERARLLENLKDLKESMEDMSDMYQPATLMATVVGHFIRDSGDVASSLPPDLPTAGTSKQPIIIPPISQGTRASTLAPPDISIAGLSSLANLLSFPSASASANPSAIPTRGTTPIPVHSLLQDPASTSFESLSTLGLPFLPSSWFEEMNWEQDTEFLNLMGLKDLQNAGVAGLGGLSNGSGFDVDALGGLGEGS
ncbi:fungal-specific transcription factor domain-containing protein [Dendryphion nanum]|uniref:Fungal-specific transcription factor domain-containing protein n=1 Tax=Dendryphion nanum TaxID=256645 RepID=A0A9P9DBF8_9PLEO|nr:fungal-specific transcription factor domain-containing protein [Dendryphion nanum]